MCPDQYELKGTPEQVETNPDFEIVKHLHPAAPA
jgi:hypothetical protein